MKRQSKIAHFVRGYFVWLEKQGIRAALLHGWEGDFEGELSDVDHVVDPVFFREIAGRVHAYCQTQGWQLCQVLRHENTAAFCVCSAIDDPTCVVALDACSDYQRNGLVFLKAGELLKGRVALGWGGFRLSTPTELRYRFIKAAAKGRDSAEVVSGFLAMDESARCGFDEWLRDTWSGRLETWTEAGLSDALGMIEARCGPRSSAGFSLSSLPRSSRRIRYPDGLLILTEEADPAACDALIDVYSGLYFRRHIQVGNASMKERIALIRSTLVFAKNAGGPVRWGLDDDCVLHLPEASSRDEHIQRVAGYLHARCGRREGFGQ